MECEIAEPWGSLYILSTIGRYTNILCTVARFIQDFFCTKRLSCYLAVQWMHCSLPYVDAFFCIAVKPNFFLWKIGYIVSSEASFLCRCTLVLSYFPERHIQGWPLLQIVQWIFLTAFRGAHCTELYLRFGETLFGTECLTTRSQSLGFHTSC